MLGKVKPKDEVMSIPLFPMLNHGGHGDYVN